MIDDRKGILDIQKSRPNFSEKGLIHRSPQNPILTAQENIPWATIKVYNPAIVRENNTTHMVFRAIGSDWVSRLGYASTSDNKQFNINPHSVFEPQESYEIEGTEDPRITKIDNQYILAYTAYDGKCARLALATSPDLHQWTRLGPVFPNWNIGFWQSISNNENNWSKAGALFPEKINGTCMMLFGDHHIWPAHSTDLHNWDHSEQPVIEPRFNHFDAGYVEMGPPPMKTEEGWLVLYHGVQRFDDGPRDPRIYRLGAALLDLQDPTKVLWRCSQPLLEPIGEEKVGIVDAMQYEGGFHKLQNLLPEELQKKVEEGESPLAIFCCGAYIENNIVNIYYSSMDTAINLATISLEDILKH